MCGINCIIGHPDVYGSSLLLSKMDFATKNRGKRQLRFRHGLTRVGFNWLPLTDESLDWIPNEHNGTVVYMNGFISNYRELASKYEIELETECDIEFLAKFMNRFCGMRCDELNGFFAVLYWSPEMQEWDMFTDRYGIKQLYKYQNDGITYISSEVKGILAACPEIELDEHGIEDWKCTLGVMNENTIYKGIERVAKLPFIIPEKIEISYEDAKDHLRCLLIDSIARNHYDGNSGVFLSGGIDSGLIASHIYAEYSFSIDYVDSKFSETDLIKLNSTGKHYCITINEEMVDEYAEKTMLALDDLKAGSCYTNFAIAELASKFLKVVYSGAGGDEFFGGYPHRKDKPIENVIVRTDFKPEGYFNCHVGMTHFEYDLKFLSAVLVIEDRMSAYHTMECRYPLLDNDLVDFALSLPDEYLENKRILKDISGLHPDVISGKKKGFSNPYFTNDEWVEFTLKNLNR